MTRCERVVQRACERVVQRACERVVRARKWILWRSPEILLFTTVFIFFALCAPIVDTFDKLRTHQNFWTGSEHDIVVCGPNRRLAPKHHSCRHARHVVLVTEQRGVRRNLEGLFKGATLARLCIHLSNSMSADWHNVSVKSHTVRHGAQMRLVDVRTVFAQTFVQLVQQACVSCFNPERIEDLVHIVAIHPLGDKEGDLQNLGKHRAVDIRYLTCLRTLSLWTMKLQWIQHTFGNPPHARDLNVQKDMLQDF